MRRLTVLFLVVMLMITLVVLPADAYRRKSRRRRGRNRIRVSRGGARSYSWLPGIDLPSGHVEGIASYYQYKGGMHAAALVAPKGTNIKVTNLETSQSITVTIIDRGPFVPGRVIDLEKDAFRVLFGSTKRGLGPVSLDW